MTIEDLFRNTQPATCAEASAFATIMSFEAMNRVLLDHGMSVSGAKVLVEHAAAALFTGHRIAYEDDADTSWTWAMERVNRAAQAGDAEPVETIALDMDDAELIEEKPRIRVHAIFAPSEGR